MNKPWLRKKETFKVELMGAVVEFRPLSFGEASSVAKIKADENGLKDIDVFEMQVNRMVKAIVDWNLTDENNVKLPISKHTINELDEEFVSTLLQKYMALSQKVDHVSEDKKKN